jgi:hypothetical protein
MLDRPSTEHYIGVVKLGIRESLFARKHLFKNRAPCENRGRRSRQRASYSTLNSGGFGGPQRPMKITCGTS